MTVEEFKKRLDELAEVYPHLEIECALYDTDAEERLKVGDLFWASDVILVHVSR